MLNSVRLALREIMEIPEPVDLDCYRLLGVQQKAPVDEIKRAFRKLALVHHPDRVTGRQDAGSRFRRVGPTL